MKDLSSLRLADLWREVKTTEEDIWGDLKLETKMYLKKLIETCLVEEQDRVLKAPRHARYKARLDYRNGYYTRSLEATLGTIEYLKVPRNRLTGLETKIFKKYKRKHIDLTELIRDCFLAGISTRIIG
jgi:putative transposase